MVENAFTRVTGREVRQAVRDGRWSTTTHGLARGYVQANLAILPEKFAFDFLRFCQRNPKPCPLLEVTDPGDPEARLVAPGSDLRTDLPGYRLYKDGKFSEEVRSIHNLWRPDHVGFVLGCSLSFDEVLVENGVRQRHLEQEGGRLAVYETNIACAPAGIFHGPLVVAMRPIRKSDLVKTIELSARYPVAHGAPVHVGDPRDIGIDDLREVQWGRYTPLTDDEVPVFWACGVTPQAIAMASGVPEMITHSAGHMFVTDLKLAAMAQ
ncbi:MAG: putative hydro-lyase [Reyranella sp.]|nr:putative hydro-lyase [Reyranella sp.]